jgi:hypothetical protein
LGGGHSTLCAKSHQRQRLHRSASGNQKIGKIQGVVLDGIYQIRVQANSFRKFELSPFKVKANVTEMINIHMEVAVFSDPF